MWKRPYQTRSPAKACATGVEEEDIHMDNASDDETRVVATEQVEARDDNKTSSKANSFYRRQSVGRLSSATNKIENLQIRYLASSQASNMDESAITFNTSSLVEFPPPLLPRKYWNIGISSLYTASATKPHSWEKRSASDNHSRSN
jgi:hypothetical protein